MSQVISIHVGGTGVNIGKACLRRYTEEHGINQNGYLNEHQAANDLNNHVHFRENSLGKWTPRSLFFDSESDQID